MTEKEYGRYRELCIKLGTVPWKMKPLSPVTVDALLQILDGGEEMAAAVVKIMEAAAVEIMEGWESAK